MRLLEGHTARNRRMASGQKNQEFQKNQECKRTFKRTTGGIKAYGEQKLSVASPAEPRGEKSFIFLQILGGEKLLKFIEKCR